MTPTTATMSDEKRHQQQQQQQRQGIGEIVMRMDGVINTRGTEDGFHYYDDMEEHSDDIEHHVISTIDDSVRDWFRCHKHTIAGYIRNKQHHQHNRMIVIKVSSSHNNQNRNHTNIHWVYVMSIHIIQIWFQLYHGIQTKGSLLASRSYDQTIT